MNLDRLSRISILTLAVSAGGVMVLSGCGDQHQKSGQSQRMSMSNEEFNRGRDDGRRDSKFSLFEDGGSWTWLWMTDKEYQKGYQYGWKEGRAEVHYNREQERAKSETRQNEPADDPSAPSAPAKAFE
ncbi:MAG TPA: hypothetical protein VNT79_16370 [Phycisphaerae bacterium]|nr:hypothetical protein [Phycisphaerae bacterium]